MGIVPSAGLKDEERSGQVGGPLAFPAALPGISHMRFLPVEALFLRNCGFARTLRTNGHPHIFHESVFPRQFRWI